MAVSLVTVRIVVSIAGCFVAPAALLAQDVQYHTPGYVVPDTNWRAGDPPAPVIPTPQTDPAPVPSFRDRLLTNFGTQIQRQPGFTTGDSTASYSSTAVPAPQPATQTTTPLYTTGPNPGP